MEMANSTHEVTLENFESIVDTHSMVLLEFWAEWCAPCRMMAPVFEEAAKRHPDVFFGRVNTEVAASLAQAFQVRSIPTLMAFKESELVLEHAGIFSPAMLDGLIHELQELSEKTGLNEADDDTA